MVSGELTHFAGEVYPAIGQQNLGLADAARIKDDLTRGRIAGVIFIPDAKVEIAERKPDALAAPPDMDHLTFERHRAAKRGTGLGRQLIFETCVERELAGADNELAHPMGLCSCVEEQRLQPQRDQARLFCPGKSGLRNPPGAASPLQSG